MSSASSARWIVPMFAIALAGCITPKDAYGETPTNGTDAPTFALTTDENHDRLIVASATQGTDWNRLTIEADKPSRFRLNSDVTSTTGTAMPGDTVVEITHSLDPMGAGEYLAFCTTATGITFTITDTTANDVMGTWTFTSIAACP